jgi:PAS domain S-box-containing protein
MFSLSYIQLAQLIVVIIYSILLIIVLRQNPKARLNQAFASLMFCFVWWGTWVLFQMQEVSSKDFAGLMANIAGFGWVFFSSCFLWFACVFTKNKILEKKAFYPVIFSIPLLLFIVQMAMPFAILVERQGYDWTPAWTNSFWTYLYFIYYTGFSLAGLYYLYQYYRAAVEKLRRQQTLLIIFSALITLVAGTALKVFFVYSEIFSFLAEGNFFLLFWALGMFFAITKYRLLSPSFTLAGKNIVDNMSEGLLLLDEGGQIVDANGRIVDLLRAGKEEIINKRLSGYFNSEIAVQIDGMVRAKSDQESIDTEISPKDGPAVPVQFSCSRVIGEDGDFMGWVCMIGDISRQKQDEADLAARNAELRDRLAELERFQKTVVDRELKMMELKEEIKRLEGSPSVEKDV